ncbi:MAG: type II toxin-antitoxin system VapC family toxin [Treponema sp.]|jgi:PIN domain nuclease of toxin-antitoxin system|nr:type II toxin-antitoxin system VapC family toxin [Treponema sp.]
MGHYLLDTHTAMWFFNGDSAISKTAKQIIIDQSNNKYLSIVSAWELAIKIGLGKLDFNGKAAGFIRLAENNGFAILPIKDDHLTALEELPMHHRDPFDRLIIATAITEDMTLITVDENTPKYEVSHIW